MSEQLTLWKEETPYDHYHVFSLFDETQFNWYKCFSSFVNYNFWTPNNPWFLDDYRDAFYELTGVCIALSCIDGLIKKECNDV